MSGSFILAMLLVAAFTGLAALWWLVSFCIRMRRVARAKELYLRLTRLNEEILTLSGAGEIEEALSLARKSVVDADADVSSNATNLLVNVLVATGRYREALTVSTSFGAAAIAAGTYAACAALLIEINQAEAEYNLGRWIDADDRLRRLEERSIRFGITKAGLRQQRAWIAANQGRAQEALALSEQIDPKGLPSGFLAEYHFTKVVVWLALGKLDEAALSAEEATAVAVRTSSARNALFIHARVAAARGDWETVEARCREAAEHKYRGQGGDGLLLWGDALARLQRGEEAKAAWRLAIERDGESESARIAAERLKS